MDKTLRIFRIFLKIDPRESYVKQIPSQYSYLPVIVDSKNKLAEMRHSARFATNTHAPMEKCYS